MINSTNPIKARIISVEDALGFFLPGSPVKYIYQYNADILYYSKSKTDFIDAVYSDDNGDESRVGVLGVFEHSSNIVRVAGRLDTITRTLTILHEIAHAKAWEMYNNGKISHYLSEKENEAMADIVSIAVYYYYNNSFPIDDAPWYHMVNCDKITFEALTLAFNVFNELVGIEFNEDNDDAEHDYFFDIFLAIYWETFKCLDIMDFSADMYYDAVCRKYIDEAE